MSRSRASASYDVTAVVPVKELARAKTRLLLPARERAALALAFALDTVAALAASPSVTDVVVVTSDPLVADRMRDHPVRLVPDGGGGLGDAVRRGLRYAGADGAGRPTTGVAVVPADLPCLRADDVDRVLLAAGRAGAFVPDLSWAGTTLLVHAPGRRPVARYGPGSATRHRALGLRALADAPVRARRDVDTLDDLRSALALGVGPRTSRVAAGLRLGAASEEDVG